MNPEAPQARPNIENVPQIPGGAEYFPDGRVSRPETAPSHEQQASQVEQLTQAAQAMPYVASPPVVAPAPPPPAVSVPITSGAPAVAADDDVIEKEWVDKVKSIIALTKGNPYEQARAVAALQADYLRKRYNRQIGESNG